MFLEVSDNPHLSPKIPTSASAFCFFGPIKIVSLQTAFFPNHDCSCSDYKIMELMASLRFGPRLLDEAAYFDSDCLLPPTTHHPLFIVSLWTQVVMAEAVG